ncbi:MAG: hypothetical protein ACRC1T_12105 [Clostridium chrysemydis]|uniref:hypothetical protein n=1 Tax=Clostridium chrysemydis TaxID=2665504 RepID=UPI003F2DD110
MIKKLRKKINYYFKWGGTIILSLIIIMMKLTFVLGIILDLIILITAKIIFFYKYIPINDCFDLDKKKNEIVQNINFRMYIETWKNDFYKNRKMFLKKVTKINLKESLISIEGLTDKEMSCKTNTIIYFYVLRKYIGKNNLRVNDDKTIRIFQPMEKLTFMSPWVVFKHLILKNGRIKFLRYLYEYDYIKTYYFNIKNL